jgi:hypothetical protein
LSDQRGHTYTEAFRHECEVRFVLKMRSPDARSQYLAGVEARRGKPAADRLRDGVRAAWPQRAQILGAGT